MGNLDREKHYRYKIHQNIIHRDSIISLKLTFLDILASGALFINLHDRLTLDVMFVFKVCGYTDRLRRELAQEVCRQSAGGRLPVTGIPAAHRRAFTLSLFNILMAEAIETMPYTGQLGYHPRIRLPLVNVDINDELKPKILAVIDSALKRLKLRSFVLVESSFDVFWAEIFSQISHTPPCNPWLQYSMALMCDLYRPFRLDHALTLIPLPNLKTQPILLTELSRLPLYNAELAHKDENKLAVCMGASLLNLVGAFRHLGEGFVSTLKTFGLLLGATDFQVCILYLDFGAGNLRGRDQDLRDFTTIFRTSRRSWRFRLVGQSYPYMSHEADDYSCLETSTQTSGPAITVNFGENPASAADPITGGLFTFLRNHFAENNVRPKRADIPGLRTVSQLASEFSANFPGENINYHGVCVLHRLLELVEAEAIRISNELTANPPPSKDDSYHYPKNLIDLMPKGRTTLPAGNTMDSPTRGPMARIANSETLSSIRQPVFTEPTTPPNPRQGVNIATPKMQPIAINDIDPIPAKLADIKCILIEKPCRAIEIEIYSRPEIQASRLFPKLIYYETVPGSEMATFNIEQVVPMWEMHLNRPDMHENIQTAQLLMARLMLDMMGAIRILHSLGIVHCDVSPNNIGFNKQVGTWQLFDFDRSLPVDVASKEPHFGGTDGFRSDDYEEYGLFLPIDDFISLALTIAHDEDNPFYGEALEPLIDLLDTMHTTSYKDIQDLYTKVFDAFCSQYTTNGCLNIESDPSYQEALKVMKIMPME
mgnify:CR=1 FL=1